MPFGGESPRNCSICFSCPWKQCNTTVNGRNPHHIRNPGKDDSNLIPTNNGFPYGVKVVRQGFRLRTVCAVVKPMSLNNSPKAPNSRLFWGPQNVLLFLSVIFHATRCKTGVPIFPPLMVFSLAQSEWTRVLIFFGPQKVNLTPD